MRTYNEALRFTVQSLPVVQDQRAFERTLQDDDPSNNSRSPSQDSTPTEVDRSAAARSAGGQRLGLRTNQAHHGDERVECGCIGKSWERLRAATDEQEFQAPPQNQQGQQVLWILCARSDCRRPLAAALLLLARGRWSHAKSRFAFAFAMMDSLLAIGPIPIPSRCSSPLNLDGSAG